MIKLIIGMVIIFLICILWSCLIVSDKCSDIFDKTYLDIDKENKDE